MWLWIVAAIVTLLAAAWQRRTGPSYPLRGTTEIAGSALRYRLPRSAVTTEDAPVRVPAADAVADATLRWRRFPTEDPFARIPMRREDGAFTAALPRQPPAGKVEYAIELTTGAGGAVRIPPQGDEAVVLRFRGPVPLYVLIPHIAAMFFAILFGTRAALAALAGRPEWRRLSLWTLGLLSIGGMVLGPIVQKHAFGEYWTGWPRGYDLTDNKTLVMWAAWLGVALLLLFVRHTRGTDWRRWVVLLAFVLMLAVYLVPHSVRGSQLDYDQLEEGVDPTDAIGTG